MRCPQKESSDCNEDPTCFPFRKAVNESPEICAPSDIAESVSCLVASISIMDFETPTSPDKIIPTKMSDLRPNLDFFKVVELEISCLGSRSKNPELEYVSNYDTFHFLGKSVLSGGYMIFRPSPVFLPHGEFIPGTSRQSLLAKLKTCY